MGNEPSPGRSTPRWLSWYGAALLIALAVLISHYWMTGLEFQLDDFEQIYQAEDLSRDAVLLGQDSEAQRSDRARPTFVQYFRPVLHYSFALDLLAFGASPFALHLSSVLYHLIACLLLFATLVRVLPPGSRRLSLVASLVFAVHPGSWGAVSWVAARGDVLMTIFLLLAVLALVRFRDRRKSGLPIAIGCTLLALLSKEGAVVCPVLIALADFFLLRHRGRGVDWRRALLVDVPLLAMAPAYLAFRQWRFAEYASFYAGKHRTMTLDVAGRMMEDLGPTFSRLVGGYFHYQAAVMTWLVSSFAALFVVALLVWTVRRPVRRLSALAFLGLLYLVAVLPTLRFYREGSGFDASRLFYLPSLFVSIATALPLLGLSSRLRLIRRVSLLFAIACLGMLGLAAWHHARAQLAAADVIARVRQDLVTIASHASAPNVAYLILHDHPSPMDPGPLVRVDYAPTYGTFMTYAFRDTFVRPPILARSIIDLPSFIDSGAFYFHEQVALQVLRWERKADDTRDKGRLVPVTRVIPGMKGWRPTLEIDAATGACDVPDGLAPRDVKVMRLVLDDVNRVKRRLTVRFIDENDGAFVATFDLDPGNGEAAELYLPVNRRREWLFASHIVRVETTSEPAEGPRVVGIETGAELPVIEIIGPRGQRLSAREPEPELTFRDPHDFPWLRIRAPLGGVTATWTLPRQRFETKDDGTLTFRLSWPGFLPGENPIPWSFLASGARGRNVLESEGIKEEAVRWRVEGLRGDIGPDAAAQGASAWADNLIVP